MLVHPDGTGSKIVSKAESALFTYRAFGYAVVWSPDSKKPVVQHQAYPGRLLLCLAKATSRSAA
jgi:hypothetical protein